MSFQGKNMLAGAVGCCLLVIGISAAKAATVVATISVGTLPAAMSINSATGRVYVANETSNTISVIDEATNSVVATIGVGTTPSDVATDRTTNRVFVTNKGSNSISVIDGSTNLIAATIAAGTTPGAISINEQTSRVYVANEGSNTVTVIDEATSAVLTTISVGTMPSHMAVDRVKNKLYVSNRMSDNISVIDAATNTVTATVAAGNSPRQIAVNDQTGRVYAVNRASNTVTILDGATNLVVGTIPVGTSPTRVTINKTTNLVYVLNGGSSTVSVIDGATSLVNATVTTGTSPTRLGLETATNRLYVVNNVSNDVTAINTSTNTVVQTIPVGHAPRNIGIDSSRFRVYVSNQADNTVSAIVEDDSPPHTYITGSPSNPSNASTATFSFRGTDDLSTPGALTFRCVLDGAPAAACISPASYSTLSAGLHTFHVAATDQAGNVDPAGATYSWTIDLTTPTTTMISTPPALTRNASATFQFSGSDTLTPAASLRFRCRLDGVAGMCASPATYQVSSATHTFDVAAVDEAGNVDPAPPSYTWTVDATPPRTTLTATPANPTNSTVASFSFTASDNRTPASALTTECRLDAAPFAVCASPVLYASVTPGSHTFQVRATDELGNVQPVPATFTWMVDVQPPVTTFVTPSGSIVVNIGGRGSPVIGTVSDDVSGVQSVAVEFTPTDTNGPPSRIIADVSCGDATRLSCRWKAMPPTIPGHYRVAARALDQAGNQESPGPSRSVLVL